MWDLWWIKLHWGLFSNSTSLSPANYLKDYFAFTIIHHPGLVQ
jgi:hypothetical protein